MIRVLYENYTNNNNILDDVDKILSDYVTTHKKKFYFYLIRCEFVLEFDNNFITNMKTNYCYSMDDITKIRSYLYYWIDCFKSRGSKFYNINQMTVNINGDRRNMTYESYINQPISMCERKIKINIAENPHFINSLDRNKNLPLIRKYSHISFNN